MPLERMPHPPPRAANKATLAPPAFATVLNTALVTVFLAPGCGRQNSSSFSDYGGLLGSCTAGEGVRFDSKTERAAISCTEHTYTARGSSDPASALLPPYAAACKDGGGAWKAGGCAADAVKCPPRAENLSLRSADVVHVVTTSWRPAGTFTLTPGNDAKLLCR
jgi:hypothetical protein